MEKWRESKVVVGDKGSILLGQFAKLRRSGVFSASAIGSAASDTTCQHGYHARFASMLCMFGGLYRAANPRVDRRIECNLKYREAGFAKGRPYESTVSKT